MSHPPTAGETGGGGPTAGVPADGEGAQGGEAEDYPRVIAGRRGLAVLRQDVENLCRPTRAVSEVMERLDRLAAAVEASGRRFVLVVAPDKSSVYPRALPDTYLGEDCARGGPR